MNVSFKQFTTFLAATEGEQTPEKLDEIWKSIFAKRKEEEEEEDDKVKSKVLTAKDRLDAKKKAEEKRKKELQKRRDDAWARAKDQAEGRTAAVKDRAGEYDWHFQKMKEDMPLIEKSERESYSSHGYWEDDAKEYGYKVKKVSGNLMDGNQTWHAFDKDGNKVGSFTEEEDGRGGWLVRPV